MYFIAILADIEKAFLEIGIQENERDVTRLLWFTDPTKPEIVEENLSVYRFCYVPFGIICSPFLLEGTLRFHLLKEGSHTAKVICDNIYGTNHPQLKRHTRVTRMCAACAKAKNTRGIKPLVYTRVHTSTRV